MKSRNKFIRTYLFSAAGIVVIALVLIVLNAVIDVFHARADLTQNNVYTLSEGTREIVNEINSPVTINFYYSKDVEGVPMRLKNYAKEVQDLLEEYKEFGGSNIRIRKIFPEPLSEAADAAELNGVKPRRTRDGNKIYLGIAVTQFKQTETIPFLSPRQRNLLEYDLTRAIDRIIHPKKTTVGVLSTLPVMGKSQRMPRRNPRSQGSQPWYLIRELKKDYNVQKIKKSASTIPSEVDILLVIHPANLSEKTLFAIDQHVLRGGHLLAFMDPFCVNAQKSRRSRMRPGGGRKQASSLGPLLDSWGVQFQTKKVLADLIYPTRVRGRNGRAQQHPAYLTLTNDAMNQDAVSTKPLDKVMMLLPGVIEGAGTEKLDRTVLMASSKRSQLVSKWKARMGGKPIRSDFSASDTHYPLAVSLHGTFKTAFPDGPPAADKNTDKNKKEQAENDSGNSDETGEAAEKQEKKEQNYLKASTEPGKSRVVLVADADMLHDRMCVRQSAVGRLLGRKVAQQISDNITFVQNKVEMLSGSTSLIKVRSRGAESRPLVVFRKMRAKARKKYQSDIADLEKELKKIRNELSQLRKPDQQGQIVLTKEQKQAIEKARTKKVETRKKLRKEKRKLRKNIENLKTSIKLANMGAVPVLVMLSGIAVGLIKRRRAARK